MNGIVAFSGIGFVAVALILYLRSINSGDSLSRTDVESKAKEEREAEYRAQSEAYQKFHAEQRRKRLENGDE